MTLEKYKELEEQGAIFQTSMDSEIIMHLLVRARNGHLKENMVEVLARLEGAFSLVFLIGVVFIAGGLWTIYEAYNYTQAANMLRG